MRSSSDKPQQKGQSLVEFAFGLIIVLILIAGVVDAGRALFIYMALRDAAQEGAQYAMIQPSDWSGIQLRARNASNTLIDLTSAVTIDSNYLTVSGQACAGSTSGVVHGVRIRVSYPNFTLTMPFIGALVGSQTIAISAVVEDTILTPPCP
jgi:Flp pilus assembly protein TadG